MDFSEVIGQVHLKADLSRSIASGRIPHAQLFVGNVGSGLLPMALAYVKEILCSAYDKDSPLYHICAKKIFNLSHPDLHFIYPVNTNEEIKKNAISTNFIEEWKEFVFKNPYASLFDWLQFIEIENKQGNISVNEAQDMLKILSLKAYEGGYKIVIIWMADRMNAECSNKILKIVEEPPEKTLLLLLTENEEDIINTLHSRCQKLHFPLLSEEDIVTELVKKHLVEPLIAKKISRQATGDFNKALHLLENESTDLIFEELFITWVRGAFRAKGNKQAINELLNWSDSISGKGREIQKKFLVYCTEVFREAMLKNYTVDELLFLEIKDDKFSLEKFAPYIHQNNIFEITDALEDAIYHIERNGNAKIIFTDLSIQLTRLIHKKELT